ncbi:TetR/AcrR family transcriptional regulator [Brachybacterium hainanense]|uniref:TetR/AcrR family transcriptional regulator n=1 Tax=Brachybacterium hainanense TaxID=1541174 RepID=A0ABV6RCR2_9MICO
MAQAGGTGSRAQARERTMARILDLGREQLIEQGPAGLSVREIARGLGMVSSAVYRYVASRDDLLTLLIADAYTDLADAVDRALAQSGPEGGVGDGDGAPTCAPTAPPPPDGLDDVDRAPPRTRFLALAEAMLDWALAHPERWTLLYGTPVRGYDAPAAATTPPGTRVMGRVLEIVAAADPAAFPGHAAEELPEPVRAWLAAGAAEVGVAAAPATVLQALTLWNGLVGTITAQVFGQMGPEAAALDGALPRLQLRLLADRLVPR